MNNEEMIREALKLNIDAPEEINEKVLRNAKHKNQGVVFFKVATLAASFCIMTIVGTGLIVKASTGKRLIEYLRGLIDNRSYVYENGTDTIMTVYDNNGEKWEHVEYLDDEVTMSHPLSENETEYNLYLKVTGENGMENFMNVTAKVNEGQSSEDLYWAIRGDFYRFFSPYTAADEKSQILAGLKEAADNADKDFIRDALIDVSADLENNRRILYEDWPADIWGGEGRYIFFEDLSDLPVGKCIIIINTVYDDEDSFIFEINIDGNQLYVNDVSFNKYSEEYYQEQLEKNLPIYDLR